MNVEEQGYFGWSGQADSRIVLAEKQSLSSKRTSHFFVRGKIQLSTVAFVCTHTHRNHQRSRAETGNRMGKPTLRAQAHSPARSPEVYWRRNSLGFGYPSSQSRCTNSCCYSRIEAGGGATPSATCHSFAYRYRLWKYSCSHSCFHAPHTSSHSHSRYGGTGTNFILL